MLPCMPRETKRENGLSRGDAVIGLFEINKTTEEVAAVVGGGCEADGVNHMPQHKHAVRGAPLPPKTSLALGAQPLLLGKGVQALLEDG